MIAGSSVFVWAGNDPRMRSYDAIVVGSAPNGLASAITLRRAGHCVLLVEAKHVLRGCLPSTELTLPCFVHDVCSAVYPLAVDSPVFATLPLDQFGLEWIYSPAPLAHPFDDGTAIVLERDVERTTTTLDRDAQAYRR